MIKENRQELHWADYLMFGLFLVISAAIGIYFSLAKGGQRNTNEFLMGSRSLSVIPVGVSILVSFTSAILILGAPAELYLNGAMYFFYPIGKIIACILATVIFVPLFYPLKLTSSFEYLELRFRSKAVRILGNIFFLLSSVLYMGIAMFAPSSAMAKVTFNKFPMFGSIALCGAIGTFYTTLGGIKAVVWTDVFQAVIMLAGLIVIIVKGTIDVGGVAKVFELNSKYGRLNFTDNVWSFDPRIRHTFWGMSIGVAVGWLGTYGTNQASVQRFCALPTLKKARLSVLLNIPGAMLLLWLTCAAGMVIFAYYASIKCDIHDIGWATSKNGIVPYYVMDRIAYPTIPGIFLASLFSGALSSISSSLNACAAVTWKDILEPYFFKNVNEQNAALITKILVCVYGVLGTGFGFLATRLGGTVLQASLAFTAAVGAPGLGIFLLGALFPHANKWGALFGGLFGLVLNLWISIGAYTLGKQEVSLRGDVSNCYVNPNATRNLTTAFPLKPSVNCSLDNFYAISYLWYASLGTLMTIGVGLLVSGITGPSRHVDPRYIMPVCHYFCCCCPIGCRTVCNCKIGPTDREDAFLQQNPIQEDPQVTVKDDDVELKDSQQHEAIASNLTMTTKVEDEGDYEQISAF